MIDDMLRIGHDVYDSDYVYDFVYESIYVVMNARFTMTITMTTVTSKTCIYPQGLFGVKDTHGTD